MNLEEPVAINQFGQGFHSIENLVHSFVQLDELEKRQQLTDLTFLLIQSKPFDSDIEQAIIDSTLKPTYTPCVVLKTHKLTVGPNRVTNLPHDELSKAYKLLLYLFRIAYLRRFREEAGNPNKWWYWDLSNADTIQDILSDK